MITPKLIIEDVEDQENGTILFEEIIPDKLFKKLLKIIKKEKKKNAKKEKDS